VCACPIGIEENKPGESLAINCADSERWLPRRVKVCFQPLAYLGYLFEAILKPSFRVWLLLQVLPNPQCITDDRMHRLPRVVLMERVAGSMLKHP